MPSVSNVDELYSVSDLHLGGPPGLQIFNQGARLAALIDLLSARPKERKVALVLNGDIVDFLAEDGCAYLSPKRAVAMLERMFIDPAFAPVWQALARYVKTPNRVLVLALGNHDVELALPWVQARIYKELCGADNNARSHIVLAMDGAGFTCQVGPARVQCTHGNEVDSWNLVDYELLEKVTAAMQAGMDPPAWDPNAGTQLVIDIMNPIKRRFPFVDLLKPETKVVPAMILAVDNKALGGLQHVAKVIYRKLRGSYRSGFLSGPESSAAATAAEEEFLRDTLLGKKWRQVPSLNEEQVLAQMEADFRAGLQPLQLLSTQEQEGMLGLGQYIWDRLTGRTPQQALREALRDWLKDDKTFELTTSDETYERLDEKTDPSVDFILAGHTHLARAIPRKRGKGMYYNSGTWIRLIKLSQRALSSDTDFAPAYSAITTGTMDALDRAEGLVLLRPSVVRIVADERGAVGDLTQLVVDERGRATLISEPQTQFIRS